MAKYTKDLLQEAVDNSTSVRGVLKYLNLKQAGGTQAHISRKIKDFEIDTSHFLGQAWNKGQTFTRVRKQTQDILIVRPPGSSREKTHLLKRAMLESGLEETCSWCPVGSTWNGKPITLEIDHENGEWLDCRIENLRFLCPNCHSQTKTYCNYSKGL